MNNSDLEKKLIAARVPERSEEYWQDFPQEVLRRIRTTAPPREPRVIWRPKLAWSLGVAIVCLVIGFVAGRHRGRNEPDDFSLLQNQKLLREVLTMFPNRVRAVEQDEHGIRLVLSENADVPNSTPLWIKICDGRNCRTVLTFSGQSFQVAKEKVEVLMDAQGQVMLVGNNFVWSSAESSRAIDHLRIQARPLSDVM